MSNNYHDCPRCSPPPMRNPRAEMIGALIALVWCIGFGVWLATSLIALR